MTSPSLLEIVPFTGIEHLAEPTNGPYIVATKTGYYTHRNFHFGRVLVPTATAPATPDAQPTLWHSIDPLLPPELIGQALSFFTAIYNSRKSEAMVDIIYNPDPDGIATRATRQGWNDRGYRLFVPPQKASGGGVKCQRNLEHYRGQMVGTIHSHCNFNAFHSGTDTHDADGHDGLHITIGDVLKPNPSIAIMISVAKVKWPFELEEITDNADLASVPHPTWWERYVSDPEPTTTWQKKHTAPTQTSFGGGAITRKPIQAPTRDHPAVIAAYANRPPTAYSLEELIWRYEDIFTTDDLIRLDAAAEMLSEIREALGTMDIELDYGFEPTFTADRAAAITTIADRSDLP